MTTTEFTAEELLALSSGLGVSDPVFLSGSPFDGWTAAVRTEVDSVGRRSLAARGISQVDDSGQLRVPEVLGTLCRVIGSPRLVVRIAMVDQTGFRLANLYLTPDYCAVLRLTRLSNFRFSLVTADSALNVMDEILCLADARWSTPPAGSEARLSGDELSLLFGTVQGSADPVDPRTMLDRSGVDPAVAESLRSMMGAGTASWVTEVLGASSDNRSAEGSITAWVAATGGLWIAEAEELGGVVYRPATGAEVQASIHVGLPSWLPAER